jgi:hypothetical protein
MMIFLKDKRKSHHAYFPSNNLFIYLPFENKFTILATDLKNLIAPHGPEIALN